MTEPDSAKNAVLKESIKMPEGSERVQGYDFNAGVNYEAILQSFKLCGFQATNFGLAVEEINKMLGERSASLSGEEVDAYEEDEFIKRKHKCTIFLGYTSNIVSSGLRETIRFLVQHRLVDCIVTTAGETCTFTLLNESQIILNVIFRRYRGGFY
jgi:deoxyhypusine synthase